MKRYIKSSKFQNLSPIFATHYDTKAAERLAKSGLFDLETSKQIISKLQNEDIHAFVRCPAFLEKYLLGIARMIIEESDGDPEKAANFIATSAPIFNQYLGYIRRTLDDESDQTLRDKLGGAEYDQHFNNEMHYSDVEKEMEDLSEKYYKEEAVEVSDDSTSDYILIPIESYEQMHEMFGGHWTGDGTGNGSGWCHTNGEYTYNNWVSGGKKFYVLAKKNWKDIKFDPVSNARNPKDEYGTSLIAICVGPNGKLENATLRCNHKGVPKDADYQYRTYGALSKLAGFDVQAAIKGRTSNTDPNSPYYAENSKYRMLKNDTIKVKGNTLYRIQAVRQIATVGGVVVNEGDLGGYIEYPDNLNEDGNAWVADKAKVLDEAYVSGDALVCEKAVISGYANIVGWAIVYGNAKVSGNAKVENAQISGNAKVSKNAYIADSAMITGSAIVTGDSWVYGNAKVYDNAVVDDQARIYNHAKIYGDASVGGSSKVYDDAQVFENAVVTRNAKVYGDSKVYGSAKICGRSEIFGDAQVCDKAIVYNGNFDSGIITKSNI